MGERELRKEIIGKGELFFLIHPGAKEVFSGYGLAMSPESKAFLVGLLMVDRPKPVDPAWLEEVETTFGEYQLVPMTTTRERGIVCQMQIEPGSISYLHQFTDQKAASIQKALAPLLEHLPKPSLTLQWDENDNFWRSQLTHLNELSPEIRQTFEKTGYGCLAAETNVGIVHVCHAPDVAIEGFLGKPVLYQWQLIEMPTSPLIRLEMKVMDDPLNPFKFESFMNVANQDNAEALSRLVNQGQLHLAFYADRLNYRFTKVVDHDDQQRQQLNGLIDRANCYWQSLPPQQRDFDRAKADFMRHFM